MKTVADLKVGDTVWVCNVNAKRGSQPYKDVVTKLGRRLIYTEWKVFRKDTLHANDGYSHSWIILDLADEIEKNLRYSLLRKIEQDCTRTGRESSTDKIRQAALLLGVNLEGVQE